MNDKGYVRVHRKILDNPIVMKDCEHLSIFIYLLLKATHTSIEQNFKGKAISLTKGQLITGREIISKELKVNSSKVQRVLSFFEKNKIIEQQTSNKNRLITIKNWDKYQFSEQQLNNKRTTTEQQLNTYNNYNNANNDNKKEKINKKEKFDKPSLEEIQKYCDERNNGINANSFYNFYESKDWFIGKNKMKDWKACVRTWEQRNSKKVKDKKDIIPKWFNNSNDKKEISPESKKELEAILKKYK